MTCWLLGYPYIREPRTERSDYSRCNVNWYHVDTADQSHLLFGLTAEHRNARVRWLETLTFYQRCSDFQPRGSLLHFSKQDSKLLQAKTLLRLGFWESLIGLKIVYALACCYVSYLFWFSTLLEKNLTSKYAPPPTKVNAHEPATTLHQSQNNGLSLYPLNPLLHQVCSHSHCSPKQKQLIGVFLAIIKGWFSKQRKIVERNKIR